MAVIKVTQVKYNAAKKSLKPLYVSFYLNKEKVQIPCKVSVAPEHFDAAAGKVTVGDKQHKDKNMMIEAIKARVNNVMVKYRLRDKVLTKDLFVREYNRPDDFKTFYDYIDYYHKQHPYEIEPSTLDVHIDVINKLKRYKEELYFDEITEDFLLNYKVYLKRKLNNKESTINKNMAVLKKYVRAAMKEGYMAENPFENIKISRKANNSFEFLTEEELRTFIDSYRCPPTWLTPGMQQSLEFFLFMCFTSLHIGDAKKMQLEQIGKTSFTYYRIKNRNSKPTPIVVPLSTPAKSIINKLRQGRTKGFIFENLLPDQKINEYLRRISEKAGIGKKLSCKAGRHTFATIFLQKTKDLATLKEILGHTDYRETLIYAHILEDTKQQGVKVFNKFLL